MGIPLMIVLLGGYIAIGLFAKEYNWRTRILLLALTFVGPAWFYLFF